MKGLNRRVVEIDEPHSELIEKVLVFLKTDSDNVVLEEQTAAGKYASRLVCYRRRRPPLWYALPAAAALLGFLGGLAASGALGALI